MCVVKKKIKKKKKSQKPIVYTNVLTIFQLETTQFIS